MLAADISHRETALPLTLIRWVGSFVSGPDLQTQESCTRNKSWQGQPLFEKEPKPNWSEVSTWRLSWRLHSTQSSRYMRTAGKQQIKLVSSGVRWDRNVSHSQLNVILEDDPRSTPGHSKLVDSVRAIMKLMQYGYYNFGLLKCKGINPDWLLQLPDGWALVQYGLKLRAYFLQKICFLL